MHSPLFPVRQRNLPRAWYGSFDITTTLRGRLYRVPHTLWRSTLGLTTTFPVLALILAGAVLAALQLEPVSTDVSPSALLAATALLYCPLHAALALPVAIACWLTGYRTAVTLEITETELIWNDRAAFPASHLWMISYGTTSHPGTAQETFDPLIEIQLGTQLITLGEELDPVAAKLFMRLFQDDIRRYWHRHN